MFHLRLHGIDIFTLIPAVMLNKMLQLYLFGLDSRVLMSVVVLNIFTRYRYFRVYFCIRLEHDASPIPT